ncbi:MAG: efflux RND transporter periplasmic adaptor subunit [Acidobacteria bacterium]|nr:efflux RND transporter periplasmic adaptor subunit [Acidobacteriota bacterium]MBI3425163.1 efflux RND transporter periplasmic adaptor subunit [Acidobacteriota bacterium]
MKENNHGQAVNEQPQVSGATGGKVIGKLQRHSRALIFAACLLPGALTLTGCHEKTATAEPAAVSVKVKAVEQHTVNKGVRYSAVIMPHSQVDLAFKVGGYVEGLLQVRGVDGKLRAVQEGDVVAAGTVLARVRQSDYAVKVKQAEAQSAEAKSGLDGGQSQFADAQAAVASSRAQLAEAEAAFGKTRLDFERAQNLFASQSMTKADYDAAKTQFESSEAKRNAARSQVVMLEARAESARAQIDVLRAKVKGSQAVISEATIPLQDTALRAPLNAVVLKKEVEIGTLVSAGKTGFTVADLNSVKAVFGVPDLAVAKLQLGAALTVTTESLPGTELSGQITRIAPAADPKSRVFEIEVTIPNPRRLLKSGMIAALEVAAAPAEPVTVVPVTAIVRAKGQSSQAEQAGQYAVFVVEDKGGQAIARTRTVKLGEALGNTMVVLDGVRAGERVITTGATLTLDGQAVQIIP